MADINTIRQELVADSGLQVSLAFVLAIRSLMRWPVDAFKYEYDDARNEQILYWLQGNSIGRLAAHGTTDNPVIAAVIHPVPNIANLVVLAKVVDEALGPGDVHRVLTVSFSGTDSEGAATAQPLSIGATDKNPNTRRQRDMLINAILDAVSGHSGN